MVPVKMGLIFGGRSGEHQVSVVSASSVYGAAKDGGFDVVGIGITRKGQWVYIRDCEKFFAEKHRDITVESGPPCHILPDPCRQGLWVRNTDGTFTNLNIQVVFPVLHGPYGEDGTIQGLLEISGMPYVGASTLASAICMDKDTTKKILYGCGVPHVPWLSITAGRWTGHTREFCREVLAKFALPVFVKPSGYGSSLGVTKVKVPELLVPAIEEAFKYDTKVMVEPSQEGCYEIECAVLGNQDPKASTIGEIVPRREFYDYQAKYEDESTLLFVPARIGRDMIEKARDIAIDAFLATGCTGMARVDFFANPQTGEVRVNELNTLPGFTPISMYPKLWEASGMSYSELVRTLVELAIRR